MDLQPLPRSRKTWKKPTAVRRPTLFEEESELNSPDLSTPNEKFRQLAAKVKLHKFEHSPITKDETRIVEIHSGAAEEEIRVTLHTVKDEMLGTEVHYAALSYHWGEPTFEHPISISDAGASISTITGAIDAAKKQLYVTKNLFRALQGLRPGKGEGSELLWVDAICIKQENEDEKKDQINKMWKIYSKADNVCIWLGEKTDLRQRAMHFVEKVVRELERFDARDQNEEHIDDWFALSQLLKSNWFSRRWVIQELALAQSATVHCGSECVSWGDFRDVICIFAMHLDDIQNLFLRSPKYMNDYFAIEDLDDLGAKVLVEFTSNVFRRDHDIQRQDSDPTMSLEYLVSTLCAFETADPRDTIVALRNMARETSKIGSNGKRVSVSQRNPPPETDYRKDLLQVYTDFLRWVFQTSKSLDILCRYWALPERTGNVPLKYKKIHKLPSWINIMWEGRYSRPKDNSGGRKAGNSFVGIPERPTYRASFGKEPKFDFGVDRYPKKRASDIDRWTEDKAQPETTQANPTLQSTDFDGNKPLNGVNGAKPPTSRRAASAPKTQPAEDNDATSPQPVDISFSQTGRPLNHVGSWPPESEQSKWEREMPMTARLSLYVTGLRIGEIEYASTPIADGVIPAQCLEKAGWTGAEDEVEEAPDKLWRTLVADRDPHGDSTPAWYHRACLHCLVRATGNGHINVNSLLSRERSEMIKRYLKRVQAVTWNRTFLEAKALPEQKTNSQASNGSKLFGLGPPKAKVNDLICVLFGCSVPVILRQTTVGEAEGLGSKDDTTCFQFIGEAYVYGKMDGEAILSSPDDLEPEEFRLM